MTSEPRPARRPPAVEAFLLHAGAFLIVLLLAACARWASVAAMPLESAALLQGVLAAAFSHWRGLRPWWLGIQVALPLACVALLPLEVPPGFFLAAFLLLLGLYWTAFRTQVPFYPSNPKVWRVVAGLVPQHRPIRFVDVGSGLGGLLLHLAERRPDSSFVGVELAPLPWLASFVRARVRRSSVRFVRGDYADLDLSSYDVVFAYLSPAAMTGLWSKAAAEMQPGSIFLSYEFPVAGVEPDGLAQPTPGGADLYCWRM